MSQVLFDNKNIEYGVRLLVACICGAIIGVERYKRSKGAGIHAGHPRGVDPPADAGAGRMTGCYISVKYSAGTTQ